MPKKINLKWLLLPKGPGLSPQGWFRLVLKVAKWLLLPKGPGLSPQGRSFAGPMKCYQLWLGDKGRRPWAMPKGAALSAASSGHTVCVKLKFIL